ncbi:DUF3990 domain-containing protein [Cohnella sp. REN36]|uniref:DUF3990 domain-containing protein n=1 Tax=Cohnella sp. REN36 TaxID=2887347 RepID=UPI001D15BC48|nr:DUF3990 domain-containing protein [Cohnella sp. REN36]MCC3374584.1 DUF3990 domain-containing protein [Cohnella sp. REN36]
MDIITPQVLYHGTTERAVASFGQRLLNRAYWRPGRDFGEGFYTTISPAQARKWAHKAAGGSVQPTRPCVLVVEMASLPRRLSPCVFLSESLAWADFIFSHRLVADKGRDPCGRHPDIVIGPMADNDTGKLMVDAIQLGKDVEWFYDQITRTAGGRRLDALRLGNQVVFSSERWEAHLRFIGYYVHAEGRWIYHDRSSQIESI